MADALCGPSNPLQTFQKQTGVDRTLQQDRYAARQAQEENFRSIPGPNAVILDAEFEAFEAGHALQNGYPEPHFFPNGPPPQAFEPAFRQVQPSNWASDFQNLHLDEAGASPIQQSQFHHHVPIQRSMPGGWHQDFLRQQGQSTSYQSQQQQQQQRPASGWAYGYTGGLMPPREIAALAQVSPSEKQVGDFKQKQPERQVEDGLVVAAFEQAFEAARSDLRFETQTLELNERGHEDAYGLQQQQAWLDHNRIGSDRILDDAEEKAKEHNEPDDADELARTAGQLLENVSGDQSKKFQDSNFLSLMRQLRDKEVRVEGDKLVDVSQPLHPGGERYPNEGGSYSAVSEGALKREFFGSLGLYIDDPQHQALYAQLKAEVNRVYDMMSFSPDAVKPEHNLSNPPLASPPYRLEQFTDESIMTAVNTLSTSEDRQIRLLYERGQLEGDNWVVRWMLDRVSRGYQGTARRKAWREAREHRLASRFHDDSNEDAYGDYEARHQFENPRESVSPPPTLLDYESRLGSRTNSSQ